MEEEPKAPQGGDLRFFACFSIHLLDFVRHEEHGDRNDEDGEQQVGDATEAVAPVVLEFLAVHVRPDPCPYTERHDRDQDRESD